ncbi:PAAR domain-containing protein [Fulvimarina endophytica]|uniref:PAAR domain-containing protein n=1 Tax=Fulvimarina endophytica TaxID=2293836 RepID=A0A371X2Y7_9HYPH|nr:PAAR domain-containing protein [Fulvimarina endophytica]RFC63598.1 PAAR domain-containing protein [Fulvimarina endophytica]
MPKIVRLGDTSTHGGHVVTAADRWECEGLPIARKTDILDCPIHGRQPIVEGSAVWQVEGQPVAREGDRAACGAVLVSGAEKWMSG